MARSADVDDRSPGPRGRGRPRSERLEQAILVATIEILAEQGIDATTVHAVADRAGVARASIYLRWPNRDALIRAAMRLAIGRPPYPLTGDLEQDIRGGADQALAVMSEPLFAAVAPVLVREFVGGEGRRLTFDELFPNRARVAEEFRRVGPAQGFRADVDGEVIIDILVGGMFNQFLANGRAPSREFADQLLAVLLAGARAPAAPRS